MLNKPRAVWCITAILMFAGLSAFGEEGIARVAKFSGEVQIQRGKQVIVPVKAGPVIRNGVIYAGDTVRTGKGVADILFEDGSIISMDERTTLKITLEKPSVPLEGGQPMERRVKLILGRVWSQIKPSKTVGTVFEIPDGIAAIRGTTVRVVVGEGGKWEFYVDEGGAKVKHEVIKTTADLEKKCGLGCEKKAENSYEFTCLWERCIDLYLPPSPYKLPDGTIEMRPTWIRDFCFGESVLITLNADGTYTITATKGEVRITRPPVTGPPPWAPIPPGEAIPPRRIGGGGGGGGGPATPRGEKETPYPP